MPSNWTSKLIWRTLGDKFVCTCFTDLDPPCFVIGISYMKKLVCREPYIRDTLVIGTTEYFT